MEFVVAAVAAIGATVGGTAGAYLIMYASQVATAALLLGSMAITNAQKNSAKRKAKAAYNDAQVDRLVNVVSTIGPRELAMGRVRKGGHVFFKGSVGTNKEVFVMCIALAAHEIDAVETVYFNDEPVTLDGSGYVTSEPYSMARTLSDTAVANSSAVATLAHTPISGTVTAYIASGDEGGSTSPDTVVSVVGTTVTTTTAGATVQYQYTETTPKAQVWSYLGTAAQTADATLIADFPGLWTSAHRARGVAYLVCRFTYDETAFPSGLPVVTALIRGAKIYDPRTATTVWTENPALMMRHVLLHPQFGKRSSIATDEDTRITAAANACDTATVYTVGGVAQASRAMFKAALVAPYGTPARDVLDDLAQAMAGQWAYMAGEFYPRAGAYTASALTLTDADLAVVQRGPDGDTSQSPITLNTHRARDQMFNVVVASIYDSQQDYKQTTLTPFKSSALITRDGAELVQQVDMPAVGYAPQALHIAGIMMREARDPLTVRLPFKLTAYRLQLFDTVSLTISRYGWSAKVFTVMAREWGADGSIILTLKETASSNYTKDANFSAQGGAANTALPSPWDVATIGALTVSSGPAEVLQQQDGTYIARMRISWPAIDDLAVTQSGQVEVQYRSAIEVDEWRSQIVSGDETQLVVADVANGVHYIVRARARTKLAVGTWSAQVAHQVLGVGLPIIEYKEHVDGWPGTKSNCAVVGTGDLESTDQAGTWTSKTTWSGFTRWNTTPYTTNTYTSAVRDMGVTLTGALIAKLDADGSETIEVRGSSVSSGAVASESWTAIGTTSLVARYVQLRVTLVATTAQPVPTMRSLSWAFHAIMRSERFTDVTPTVFTGLRRIAVGHVRLPLTRAYTLITSVQITVRDSRSGVWTWSLLDKFSTVAKGPRVEFRLDGVATDPEYIDGIITGV